MTLGEAIHAARKAEGWTQQDLADVCGVTRQLFSLAENGKSDIASSRLKTIAWALGRTFTVSARGWTSTPDEEN